MMNSSFNILKSVASCMVDPPYKLLECIDVANLDWDNLSLNPRAIQLLEKNLDKINWDYLSLNPNAISILEAHLDRVYWPSLSQNPNAIHRIEANLDRVSWHNLALNPNGVHLIETYIGRVDLSNDFPGSLMLFDSYGNEEKNYHLKKSFGTCFLEIQMPCIC